jgi:hypothetical protein
MRTAVHRSPNKLWRSNIFIIWMARKSDFDVPGPLFAVRKGFVIISSIR